MKLFTSQLKVKKIEAVALKMLFAVEGCLFSIAYLT